jgi:hypothetical protein
VKLKTVVSILAGIADDRSLTSRTGYHFDSDTATEDRHNCRTALGPVRTGLGGRMVLLQPLRHGRIFGERLPHGQVTVATRHDEGARLELALVCGIPILDTDARVQAQRHLHRDALAALPDHNRVRIMDDNADGSYNFGRVIVSEGPLRGKEIWACSGAARHAYDVW